MKLATQIGLNSAATRLDVLCKGSYVLSDYFCGIIAHFKSLEV